MDKKQLQFPVREPFFSNFWGYTVKPSDSKPVDSKLQALVNFLLLIKISNHSMNHKIDNKHLAIVNIFAPLNKFTKVSFDCSCYFPLWGF